MRFANLIATLTLASALTLTAQTSTTPPPPDPIVGTWAVKVPGPTPEDDFYAIHTFHQDGTFTENSSLLPTLSEGPAQGSWKRDGNVYKLVFLLFAFDEHGDRAGYIRVRNTIKLAVDRLDSDSIVDFIAPDGTVEPAIAEGPFFGLRQKVDTPANLADVPHATSLSGERGSGGDGSGIARSGTAAHRRNGKASDGRRWSRMLRK